MSYPQYAASLFAGNDLCRSAFAFAAILFARPMFINLGIGRGVSLLGGLSRPPAPAPRPAPPPALRGWGFVSGFFFLLCILDLSLFFKGCGK